MKTPGCSHWNFPKRLKTDTNSKPLHRDVLHPRSTQVIPAFSHRSVQLHSCRQQMEIKLCIICKYLAQVFVFLTVSEYNCDYFSPLDLERGVCGPSRRPSRCHPSSRHTSACCSCRRCHCCCSPVLSAGAPTAHQAQVATCTVSRRPTGKPWLVKVVE